MTTSSVNWNAQRLPDPALSEAEGLRERKKRLMHQQLSDTATQMFLERGFDAVRVTEVAAACNVSEKTVFNYFPTKESLLLDRWDGTMAALRSGLADTAITPVQAVLGILSDELGALTSWIAAQSDVAAAISLIQRFGVLIGATPALQAHQREVTDRLVAVAAEVLAERAHMKPEDPEPQIAAIALLGLWRVQSQSLKRHMDGVRSIPRIRRAIMNDVERAAGTIEAGLHLFDR